MKNETRIIIAEVLDESITFNMHDMCNACNISSDFIMNMVEYGLLEPEGEEPLEWIFSPYELRRLQSAIRIQRDFSLDFEGLGLVLELLEEVQELRQRIHVLEQQLLK